MVGDNSIMIVQSLIPTQDQKEAQDLHQVEESQFVLRVQSKLQSVLDQEVHYMWL